MSPTDVTAHYFDKSSPSKAARWSGYVLQGIATLFLVFDCAIKIFPSQEAIQGTGDLGFSTSALLPLGLIELVCLILYLVPRTSVLGALLWTGYLGGAIATHFRLGNPLPTHTLFPIYVAILIWGGIWLRDERLRALIPFRSRWTLDS